MYWPQPYHHVQEIQKYNIQEPFIYNELYAFAQAVLCHASLCHDTKQVNRIDKMKGLLGPDRVIYTVFSG